MLDTRTSSLLEVFLRHTSVSNSDIQSMLSLSRRQVDYAINKLNDWLLSNHLSTVQKNKGLYFLNESTKTILSNDFIQESGEYIPSEEERTQLILLHLALTDDYISLEHLIQLLGVSKNTVMRDMKALDVKLKTKKLIIEYTRSGGYIVKGDESSIRNEILSIINTFSEKFELNQMLMTAMNVSESDIDQMIDKLSVIESILERKFADTYFYHLPYHLLAIIKRIKQGTVVEDEFFIDYKAISDTKEYEASKTLLVGEDVKETDLLYIALRILATPVRSKAIESFSLPALKSKIELCVLNFEQISCTNLQDKQQLIEKLYTHMKPAYFRIRYNLTTNYRYLEELDEKYEALFALVEESFRPLEDYLECSIPKQELMLITLFFGGNLIDTQEVRHVDVKRAIVVCPNGITISNLLERTLIRLLPEIFFEGSMSVRDFEESLQEFDFVFSQVPLNTHLNVIQIGDLQSKNEQLKLRRRVISELYNLPNIEFDTETIFNIIERYADVKEEDELKKHLLKYFSEDKVVTESAGKEFGLMHTLPESRINVVESVNNFHEAIELAAQPLLDEEIISESYIERMKEIYQTIEPHILLRAKIAIPHAEIETGSNGLGLSLLKINQPLVTEYGNIYFVCVIAAKDKESHLDSILELIKAAEDDEIIAELEHSIDAADIYRQLVTHH